MACSLFMVWLCLLCVSQKIQRKSGSKPKILLKFSIDCSTPVEDELMDAGAFVSIYLRMYTSLISGRFDERWYAGLGQLS